MEIQDIATSLMALDESDAQSLLGCSRLPELAGLSPDFASWLRQMLHTELKRRDGEDIAFPEPDFAGWSDRQVADGIAASVLLSASTVTELADAFARSLATFFALHAATRLYARDLAATN